MTPRIEQTTFIQASPQVVWQLLTESDQLARWFPSSAETDPRPGGRYKYRFESAGEEGGCQEVAGEYTVVEPYRKLVHTWEFDRDGQPVSSTVEWRLAPKDEGTELTLIHDGFRGPGLDDAGLRHELDEHRSGWDWFVGNLKGLQEGRDDVRVGRLKTGAS